MNATAAPAPELTIEDILSAPELEPLELSLADYCDRCGHSEDNRPNGEKFYHAVSQAFVAVRVSSGTVLKFCGHHYAKHETALVTSGAEVLDTRDKINAQPMSGLADIAGQAVAQG